MHRSRVPVFNVNPVNGAQIIDRAHSEIHEGESYVAADIAVAIGAGASVFWSLTVPANKSLHFNWDVIATGQFRSQISEGVIVTGAGAVTLTPSNKNRLIGDNSTVSFLKDTGAGFGGGTVFSYVSRIGTVFAQSTINTGRNELNLAPATIYGLTVTAPGAGITVDILLDWYEV